MLKSFKGLRSTITLFQCHTRTVMSCYIMLGLEILAYIILCTTTWSCQFIVIRNTWEEVGTFDNSHDYDSFRIFFKF